MAEDSKSKKPAAPRRETMDKGEAEERLEPHYFPDHGRSVMARDQEHAAKVLKEQLDAEGADEDKK